ncbi:hypothetical protein CspHIS471_0603130 [Cutaneotrichosporon sp. HIS471]|nr:hypothetical protein CspHIS471_0603130 [Cutaneotrichosporon sp. HIS471]
MQLLPPVAALSGRALVIRLPRRGLDTAPDTAVSSVAALVLLRCLWALGAELGITRKDKRREVVADGLGVGVGVLQTICWGLATRHVGPLRPTMIVFLSSSAANASTLTSRAASAAAIVAVLTFVTAFGDEATAGSLAALAAISGVAGKLGAKRRRDDGWAVPMLAAAAAGSVIILVLSSLSLPLGALAAVTALASYLPLHGLTSLALPSPSGLAYLALAQIFALPPRPPLVDLAAVVPAVILAQKQAIGMKGWAFPRPTPSVSTGPMFSLQTPLALLPAAWRPHLLTVIRTPASRRIFGFLCLNLAYMGVQMGYGIATNSLGLISDAIHMLFDCLGIGVGLWASVAATWKPDGQYTLGYSRVETLSGFVNGCFLILISIFIIFEAIQRVLNPPEMETRQLLLPRT